MDQRRPSEERKRFWQILRNNSCGILLREFNNSLLETVPVLDKMSCRMKEISRRHFLQMAGATVVAAMATAIPVVGEGEKPRQWHRPAVRIRPLSSANSISKSEQAFYRKARFSCAADAMRAVASRGMTAEIYVG